MVTIVSSVRAALGVMVGVLSAGVALAQTVSKQDMPAQDSTQNGGAGIRTGHIAATGRTMPNPGASQSIGATPMDRGIQDEDKKIESSICKGC